VTIGTNGWSGQDSPDCVVDSPVANWRVRDAGMGISHTPTISKEYLTMEMVGEHTFNVPREKVWSFMLDPEVLKACLPGCEKLEAVGEDEYVATMKIGISFIKGTFTGKVKITDKNEPESYTMQVEGSGPQGQVSGVGQLELVDVDGTSTIVKYKGDANVRGSLARVGARMIQPAAKTIVGQFFSKMESEAASRS
jgi:carbon monoxide dehydrogenase subunit G